MGIIMRYFMRFFFKTRTNLTQRKTAHDSGNIGAIRTTVDSHLCITGESFGGRDTRQRKRPHKKKE